MKRERPSAHAGAELEQLHNDCKRWRNDFSALPLPVWGEGWGEGDTELSRDLNPSPHPSPYGRGSRSSLLPGDIKRHDSGRSETALRITQKRTRPLRARRRLGAELVLEARIGAQRVALENLLLVLGREPRRVVDVALGVVEILSGLRILAAHRADHLGGEQNIVDRHHLGH